MEEFEVVQYLGDLGANLRKAELEEHAAALQSKDEEWISALQRQLMKDYWKTVPMDRQMTLLYILNGYLREEHKQQRSTQSWIDVMQQVFDGLNIQAHHGKEVKHILKIINVWSVRVARGKESDSAATTSVFPKKVCDQWSDMLHKRADSLGINLTETAATTTNSGAPLKHSESTSALATASTAAVPSSSAAPAQKIQARVFSVRAVPLPTSKTQPVLTQPTLATISEAAFVSRHSSAGQNGSSDVTAQFDKDILLAMCKFQQQIFQTFLKGAQRRLDGYNMKVVMTASYWLLHLYVREYGVREVQAAALVVACIYLAGKAEYLFVKADKLRPIANKFVTLALNEPQLTNNKQIYHYEQQMLFLLNYNVGGIGNPVRFLKALDILAANRIDDKRSNDNVNAHNSSSSSTAGPIGGADEVVLTTLTATSLQQHNAARASGNSSPRSASAAEQVTPGRELLDRVVAQLATEAVMFDGALLLDCDDYFLAAGLVLEQVQRNCEGDDEQCRATMQAVLQDLAGMSSSLRQGRSVLNTEPGSEKYRFIGFLEAFSTQATIPNITSPVSILAATSSQSGAPLPLVISLRTIALLNEALPVVKKAAEDAKIAAALQAKQAAVRRQTEWDIRDAEAAAQEKQRQREEQRRFGIAHAPPVPPPPAVAPPAPRAAAAAAAVCAPAPAATVHRTATSNAKLSNLEALAGITKAKLGLLQSTVGQGAQSQSVSQPIAPDPRAQEYRSREDRRWSPEPPRREGRSGRSPLRGPSPPHQPHPQPPQERRRSPSRERTARRSNSRDRNRRRSSSRDRHRQDRQDRQDEPRRGERSGHYDHREEVFASDRWPRGESPSRIKLAPSSSRPQPPPPPSRQTWDVYQRPADDDRRDRRSPPRYGQRHSPPHGVGSSSYHYGREVEDRYCRPAGGADAGGWPGRPSGRSRSRSPPRGDPWAYREGAQRPPPPPPPREPPPPPPSHPPPQHLLRGEDDEGRSGKRHRSDHYSERKRESRREHRRRRKAAKRREREEGEEDSESSGSDGDAPASQRPRLDSKLADDETGSSSAVVVVSTTVCEAAADPSSRPETAYSSSPMVETMLPPPAPGLPYTDRTSPMQVEDAITIPTSESVLDLTASTPQEMVVKMLSSPASSVQDAPPSAPTGIRTVARGMGTEPNAVVDNMETSSSASVRGAPRPTTSSEIMQAPVSTGACSETAKNSTSSAALPSPHLPAVQQTVVSEVPDSALGDSTLSDGAAMDVESSSEKVAVHNASSAAATTSAHVGQQAEKAMSGDQTPNLEGASTSSAPLAPQQPPQQQQQQAVGAAQAHQRPATPSTLATIGRSTAQVPALSTERSRSKSPSAVASRGREGMSGTGSGSGKIATGRKRTGSDLAGEQAAAGAAAAAASEESFEEKRKRREERFGSSHSVPITSDRGASRAVAIRGKTQGEEGEGAEDDCTAVEEGATSGLRVQADPAHVPSVLSSIQGKIGDTDKRGDSGTSASGKAANVPFSEAESSSNNRKGRRGGRGNNRIPSPRRSTDTNSGNQREEGRSPRSEPTIGSRSTSRMVSAAPTDARTSTTVPEKTAAVVEAEKSSPRGAPAPAARKKNGVELLLQSVMGRTFPGRK